MNEIDLSYEALVRQISEIPAAGDEDQRRVQWIPGPESRVGVSRGPDGGIEIFLACPQVVPSIRSIAAMVKFDPNWRDQVNPGYFEANRIVLHECESFDQIGAFLVLELLRNGGAQQPFEAFARSEEILAHELERISRSIDDRTGLSGELLLLSAFVHAVDANRVPIVLAAWQGSARTSRDFQFSTLGVEVKTTTLDESRHPVSGVRQVEPGSGNAGNLEEHLLLVSVGVSWASSNEAETLWSIPSLVQSIVNRVEALVLGEGPELVEEFLTKVASYGANPGLGYDHRTMADDHFWAHKFGSKFVRCYDMGDPKISVLRSVDLARLTAVDRDSVRFTVVLPQTVDGAFNPINGQRPSVEHILRLGGVS